MQKCDPQPFRPFICLGCRKIFGYTNREKLIVGVQDEQTGTIIEWFHFERTVTLVCTCMRRREWKPLVEEVNHAA